jgi:hypothetical protein
MKRSIDPSRIEAVDDAMAKILREKSPSQRLEMAFSAHRTARMLLLEGLRHQHADWTAEQLSREVARRMLGTV